MNEERISITSCCLKYEIERSFIETLEASGLLEVVIVDNERWVPYSELPQLERYIRWHYELDINPEGIETVQRLLHKINNLQAELGALRSRLKAYEEPEY